MEIGLLKIIEISYNISTLILLSIIAYLLLKEKYVFEKLKRNKNPNQHHPKNRENLFQASTGKSKPTQLYSQKNNLTGGRPYELVKKLSKHGLTKREISKKLGLPCGEVELALKF